MYHRILSTIYNCWLTYIVLKLYSNHVNEGYKVSALFILETFISINNGNCNSKMVVVALYLQSYTKINLFLTPSKLNKYDCTDSFSFDHELTGIMFGSNIRSYTFQFLQIQRKQKVWDWSNELNKHYVCFNGNFLFSFCEANSWTQNKWISINFRFLPYKK